MEIEIGRRLMWTILILGILFLAERAALLWKNAKLNVSDWIGHTLAKKNKIIEGSKEKL